MKNGFCGAFLVFLATLLYIPIKAQEKPMVFLELNLEAGLSSLMNAHLNLDDDGFFWAGGRDGIGRFDGQKVKTFRPYLDKLALDPNINSELFQRKNKDRFFTSNSALHCIPVNKDTVLGFQFFPKKNSYYYAFHLEADRFLWFIANNQLFRLDLDQQPYALQELGDFPSYSAKALVDSNQQVIQTLRSLSYEGYGLEICDYDQGELNDCQKYFSTDNRFGQPLAVIYFTYADQNTLWLSSSLGLIQMDRSQPEQYQIYHHSQSKLQKSGYSDIIPWGQDYFWLSSYQDGLLLFDRKTKKFVEQHKSIMVNGQEKDISSIDRLYSDGENTLWLNCFDQGIYYANLKNIKFSRFSELNSGGLNVNIQSLSESEARGLYLFSPKSIFIPPETRKDNTNLQKSLLKLIAPFSNIYRAGFDSENLLWVLKNNGINGIQITNKVSKKVFELPQRVFRLAPTRASEVCFLGSNALYLFNKKDSEKGLQKITSVNLPSELFFEAQTGMLLLAQGDNTLRVFDTNNHYQELDSITNLGTVYGFSDTQVDAVSPWIATNTGLYQINLQTLEAKKIKAPNQQLDQAFVSVIEDSLGKVWLGSYWGLYRFDPNTAKVDHFTQSDGLISMQYNPNASHYGSDGKLYFGGNKGVTIIDPKNTPLNQNLPKIQLIKSQVNYKEIAGASFAKAGQSNNFPYKQNNLTFDFSVLEFTDPKLNRFSYAVINQLKDTINVGDDTKITLNLIAPGQYQIHCYAFNSDGIGTEEPYQLFFTIRPPWYRTWWAQFSGLFILMGSFYAWYKYRIRQIKKRETFKRKEAEFKQKEAEYKQLAAETETAVLRLQMNPHFIFNSMNSINSYILKKDIDSASAYLDEFAQLMRMTLELSEHPYNTIEEELEFLELYLNTEARRLDQTMEYTFVIDPNLDIEETLVPTLILQPFIENAIWHGLSPKIESGLITVAFKSQNKGLLCTIEDNGVGRAFHQKRQKTDHKSKAIAITKRRLALLESKTKQTASVEIADLYDSNSQPSGTKVSLLLPFID